MVFGGVGNLVYLVIGIQLYSKASPNFDSNYIGNVLFVGARLIKVTPVRL